MCNTRNGFSFIEVMVAMVVLSMSLVILLNSQGQSMDLIGRARTLDTAATLASSKMAELTQLVQERGITALKETESGEFEQEQFPGYRWKYQTLKIQAPDFAALMKGFSGSSEEKEENTNEELFAGPLKQIQEIWGEAIRELHVEVLWPHGGGEMNYELVTHLIATDAVQKVEGMIGGLTGG